LEIKNILICSTTLLTHFKKRSFPWSASLSHSSVPLVLGAHLCWPWASCELQTQLSYMDRGPHVSHTLPLPSR